jgi:methylated-DNA-[protein]-cysteine S-methyltransferase
MVGKMTHDVMSTPVGWLRLSASDQGLTGIWTGDVGEASLGADAHPILAVARQQLAEYFAGQRTEFDLPLAPAGTDFQQKVWAALRRIPFGMTCSYADLARAIRQPTAARAAGGANGRNPLMIVVPCHRVIAADGTLGGFSSGLDVKRWLLRHEGVEVAAPARPMPAAR